MHPNRIPPAAWLVASLVLVLGGLAASAMLLVDYLRPTPVFCAEGGGCDTLRHTALAEPLGVPLPAIGVLGFLVLGAVALQRGAGARTAQMGLSAVAGLVGMSLLAVQAWMGALCGYCAVADGCAIASVAIAAGRLVLEPPAAPAPKGLTFAAAILMPLAVALPLFFGFRVTSVPGPIREELAQTPRGQALVVDFVDFECPFCRMAHTELEPMIDAHRPRIRLVRIQVPLRAHPHALDAARAACCGEELGRGDAMADALFAAPVGELTPEGCERIAEHLGLPLDRFRACVADPRTLARIELDRAKFKAIGGQALPTVWIGDHEIVGVQPRETLAKALDEALHQASVRAGS